MKCDACGAPVENGRCTYCGKDFSGQPGPGAGNTPGGNGQGKEGPAPVKMEGASPVNDKSREKPKKKIGCGTIVIALVVIGLIGSIFGGGSDKEESSPVAQEETASGTGQDVQENGAPEALEVAETKADAESFTALVVADNEECKITITELVPNSIWGYGLKAELENKSAEKSYRFSVDEASVNGVEAFPVFSETVAAQKKAVGNISLLDGSFEKYGIGDYTDIEITFVVRDSEDWTAYPVAEETVHVYPYGEDAAQVYVRETADDNIVLLDDENLSVVFIGFDADTIFGYAANIYIVNKSEKNIVIASDEESVNGYMVSPLWVHTVSAGKQAFTSMRWGNSSLEEIGITDPGNEIETIDFVLRAYDADNILEGDLVNMPVSVTVKK